MDQNQSMTPEVMSPVVSDSGNSDDDAQPELVPEAEGHQERVTAGTLPQENEVPMSKRKRKKLEQKLKKQQYLKDKRQKERLRKKERLKAARAQGIDMGPSRKALKHNTMEKSQCKVKVVIDCSFDNLMTEKDIKSIVKQVNFCYAANRRATDPVQFHVTSFTGQVKETMDNIGDYHKWDVFVHTGGFLDVFDKQDMVYLSSDSKNVLDSLGDNHVYIIGGLVDHNHHKGLCLELAEKRGLQHAQLPIGAYVSLESRNTLTVNHVFEILLRYTESRDWKDAFYKVIPKRKVTVATENPSGSSDNNTPLAETCLRSTKDSGTDSDESAMNSGDKITNDGQSSCTQHDHSHSMSLEDSAHKGELDDKDEHSHSISVEDSAHKGELDDKDEHSHSISVEDSAHKGELDDKDEHSHSISVEDSAHKGELDDKDEHSHSISVEDSAHKGELDDKDEHSHSISVEDSAHKGELDDKDEHSHSTSVEDSAHKGELDDKDEHSHSTSVEDSAHKGELDDKDEPS